MVCYHIRFRGHSTHPHAVLHPTLIRRGCTDIQRYGIVDSVLYVTSKFINSEGWHGCAVPNYEKNTKCSSSGEGDGGIACVWEGRVRENDGSGLRGRK